MLTVTLNLIFAILAGLFTWVSVRRHRAAQEKEQQAARALEDMTRIVTESAREAVNARRALVREQERAANAEAMARNWGERLNTALKFIESKGFKIVSNAESAAQKALNAIKPARQGDPQMPDVRAFKFNADAALATWEWGKRHKAGEITYDTDALDAIAAICGCAEWEYPGQVVRDVQNLRKLADEQKAAIEEWKSRYGSAIGLTSNADISDPAVDPCAGCIQALNASTAMQVVQDLSLEQEEAKGVIQDLARELGKAREFAHETDTLDAALTAAEPYLIHEVPLDVEMEMPKTFAAPPEFFEKGDKR